MIAGAERGLEAEHPGRCLIERFLFRLGGMWCVVGRDRVDRAVDGAGPDRFDVGGVRNGGLTLYSADERREQLVGQADVMRGGLGGDCQPVGLGPPYEFDASDGRQVEDVNPAPVSRTSSMSRCTISSSASAGQPGRPRREQHEPRASRRRP